MRAGEDGSPAVRVLGIDPGTNVTGWGVLERCRGTVRHVTHGTVRTPADASRAAKLAAIHRALVDCCGKWRPHVVALEETFVGRNVQSAFRLGEVRGVAMLVAATTGASVAEYSPAQVKLAVTGTGSADKLQIGRAVSRELRLEGPLAADAADALAIAMCHLYSTRSGVEGARDRRAPITRAARGRYRLPTGATS